MTLLDSLSPVGVEGLSPSEDRRHGEVPTGPVIPCPYRGSGEPLELRLNRRYPLIVEGPSWRGSDLMEAPRFTLFSRFGSEDQRTPDWIENSLSVLTTRVPGVVDHVTLVLSGVTSVYLLQKPRKLRPYMRTYKTHM